MRNRHFQFTLTQLFMAVWLVAIVLTFLRSEGRGRVVVAVTDLEFSPDGSCLAVVRLGARMIEEYSPTDASFRHTSRTISFLDAATGSTKAVVERTILRDMYVEYSAFRPVETIAFTSAGDALYVQRCDRGQVKRYDLASRKWEQPLPEHGYVSWQILLHKRTNVLATADQEGIVLWDAVSGTERCQFAFPEGRTYSVFDGLAFSADGKLLASAGCRQDGNRVYVCSTLDGSIVDSPTELAWERGFCCVAFSPVRNTLATANSEGLRLYDVETSHVTNLISDQHVSQIAFSPDGGTLAAHDNDRVLLVDVAAGRVTRILPARSRLYGLAFSPDGALLAAGDAEGLVTVWDTSSWQEVFHVTAPGVTRITWAAPAAMLLVWIIAYSIATRRRRARGRGVGPRDRPATT
jgi:WD40 repeat protein